MGGLVRVFGLYFVNMAKAPSVNNNVTLKQRRRPKWKRHCCNRPQKRWTRVNKVVVCGAPHGWEELVRRAYDRKRPYGANSGASCLSKRMKILTCDVDSSTSSLIQDLTLTSVKPLKMDGVATAIKQSKNHAPSIIAISATISSLGRKPDGSEGNVSKVISELKTIIPNRHVAFNTLFVPALRVSMSTAGSTPDNIRGSHRFHLGFADHPCNVAKGFRGLPREETGCMAWYPRIHHEHMKDGSSTFLSNAFPIITKCFELCDLVKPGFTTALETICHPLVFPFEATLGTNDGSSLNMCLKNTDREAQRFFTRMSVSTIAGSNVMSQAGKWIPRQLAKVGTVPNGCNKFISAMVHRDSNDIGKGGVLHPKHKPKRYIDHGRTIITGDENDNEILQLVIAISYKCHNAEGLAVLPSSEGDEVFLLEPPKIVDSCVEEVRLQLYALDYSHRLHANIHPSKELHPDAWCIRITCYATVHAATWSKHIRTLSNSSSLELINSIYQLPGFVSL